MKNGDINIDEIKEIIEAAKRLGVEINEDKAIKWLKDIKSAEETPEDLIIDESQGIYGHEFQLIDFDSKELERFRKIAEIVGIPNSEGIETAISLSGSAAQGKVQRFPGDLDYFERVNIIAPTKEEACKISGQIIRKKSFGQIIFSGLPIN
ncbi:MAG: hypothetical protein ACTSWR_10695 [Candidatus Helarchaeota archaeon]